MRSRVPRTQRRVPPIKRISRINVKPVCASHESAVKVAAHKANVIPDERLQREKLERELCELKKKYEGMKGKYKALKMS